MDNTSYRVRLETDRIGLGFRLEFGLGQGLGQGQVRGTPRTSGRDCAERGGRADNVSKLLSRVS
eukprot:1320787-Amorphochlora_amoeboformis.AAC.1